MIRIVDIQEKLLHLIGWRQSYDRNDGAWLSKDLTESESGQYYQDVHPLLTLSNLLSIAPDFKNYDYPDYSFEDAYKEGEVVKLEDKYYKALQDISANTILITDTDYWKETNPFSEWLENKTKASIVKAINRFVNEKIVKSAYKVLCEKKTLFDGTGRIYDTVRNRKNFVGFEIVPIRSKGVTTKINRIGLQFTNPGYYTIYLMHSSRLYPFYAERFEKTKAYDMEWFTPSIELYLPYESSEIDAGGSWFLCYSQSCLPLDSQAVKKNRDWSKGPCNECSRHEYENWKAWSKYLEVHPFSVSEDFVEWSLPFNNDFNDDYDKFKISNNHNVQMWDIEKNIYDYSTNYGINLDISVECDISDFIIEQRLLFTDYLCKSLAVDFLREFAYNPNVRTNRHSINASRPDILYEIDGDSSSLKKSGMSYQLELALNSLKISTEGIDRVCMPCINHGIKYRTV